MTAPTPTSATPTTSAASTTSTRAETTTATGTTTAGLTPRPRPAHAGPPADEGRPTAYRPRPLALRLRLRPRTVRARIVSLLMVPVVSLLALWGFATVTTAQQIDSAVRLKHVDETLLQPIDATVSALQAERTAALSYLAAPSAARMDAYTARARATDGVVATMGQNLLRGEPDAVGLAASLPSRITALDTATGSLRQLRTRVESRQVGWTDAANAYAGAVNSGFGVVGALTGVQNSALGSDARVLLELSQAREMLAREDAAVQAGQAGGRMTPDQFQEFTGAHYARQALQTSAGPDLRPADLTAYQQVTGGQQATALSRLEDAVRTSDGGARAVMAAGPDWTSTAGAVQQQLDTVLTAAGTQAGANADPYSLGVLTKNGAAVLFGLAAVVLSLLISVRIGRGLVVELVELRNSALELAGRRLPAAMRRLRAGEEIDIEAEAPVVEAGDDELGQVGEALNTVQRAALTAAVERAEVLSGVSGVFVNLARRSQVLVHRQLTLLDAMERRTEDPAELDDLFRLDHLTTRMRRHAEGLIILSGAAPGRAWRKPVPLLDVVRSAVAEVEDYSRVDVRRLPGVSVVGAAVADLTHLLAELVENATAFSPPHTKVLVSGEQVGAGYAVEIEDRGLGMGKDAIAEANRRIADAQQADLFDSDRLGLFVVSRLARRHGVRVSLRPSAYGGTTAVILLPSALLETPRPRRRAPLDAELDLPPVTATAPTPVGLPADAPANGPAARHGGDAGEAMPYGRPAVAPGAGGPAAPGHGEAEAPAPFGPPATPPGPAGPAPDTLGGEPGGPLPFGRPVVTPGAGVGFGAAGGESHGDQRGKLPIRNGRASVLGSRDEAPYGRPPGSGGGGGNPAAPEGEELPRRVRQASLAVQLREAPPPEPPRMGRAAAEADERSPEQARATMAALRDGWNRGRSGGGGGGRHLRLHQDPSRDAQPYDDFEDFERSAADGRDDESHR